MSGELQTIPARHGVATFVPRGRSLKVINTYGKQVVSMWAFTLGPAPEEEAEEQQEEKNEEEVQREAEELKQAVEEDGNKGAEATEQAEKKPEQTGASEKESQDTTREESKPEEETEDPPEQAPDSSEHERTTESTASSSKHPAKRPWSSYLPSIPYRNKGASNTEGEKQPSTEEEKAQDDENTKRWSSYLPTGKAFSSYVPSLQLPDSKNVVSAFRASHPRDPNKSYAEQLYDFSKTPVGAGTLAAATGSGYASSVYAAYSAYTSTNPWRSSQPPMEYLSLSHTRASSYKLVPEVDDELLSNLRNPIITIIEDTTPGAHDTLTAACDAYLYTALGVEKPEEHGSCAENLVIALKELNESVGLKGAKAIGADISVNNAPTPLHLFMNAPLQRPNSDQSEEGVGAKGTVLKVEEAQGKKRSFVRFRAERDTVFVFSACPMDIGPQNGGKCMAANFVVEDVQEGEDLSSSVASIGKKRETPKKLSSEGKKMNTAGTTKKNEPSKKKEELPKEESPKEEKPKKEPPKKELPKKEPPKKEDKALPRRDSGVSKPATPAPKAAPGKQDTKKEENKLDEKAKTEDQQQPAKRKPKKLQVRSASSQNVTKSS